MKPAWSEELDAYRKGTLTPDACSRLEERARTDADLARALRELQQDARRAELLGRLPRGDDPTPRPEIDGYEILDEIHRGGQGIVYRARERATDRVVALKLLLAGVFASRQERHRFEREIDLLAHLDHPNVVPIFHSGTTREGHPFCVMPYIEGDRLDDFVLRRKLGLADTLRLFRKVAEAVHHAHLHGVIHRDLKPANILVDGNDEPKVIDFGIARQQEDEAARSLLTLTGQVMGTLGYMAPEQLGGERVDARCDVYALGVILYELICGRSPLVIEGQGLSEILGRLKTETVPHPTTVRAGLPRDLGWIALRALEIEPDRRYGSAGELAQEIDRFLDHEPVLAGPPSASYRLKKFVRRHRIAVSFSVALLLTLVAGIIVAGMGWMEALDQEAAAKQSARRAHAARDFLSRLLSSPVPGKEGRDVRMVDLLSRAEEAISRELKDDPELEEEIRQTLASSFQALTLYPEARAQFDRLLPLMRELRDPEDEELLRMERVNATNLRDVGRPKESLALLDALLPRQQRILGEDHDEVLHTRHGRVATLMSELRYADALEPAREVLRLFTERFEPDSEELYAVRLNLCRLLRELASPEYLAEAEELALLNLETVTQAFGPDHHYVMSCQSILAAILESKGELEAAEEILLALTRRYPEVYGEDSSRVVTLTERVANLYRSQRRMTEAEEWFRRALDGAVELYGDESSHALRINNQLGLILVDLGKQEEVMPIMERLVELTALHFGEDDPRALISRYNLAYQYIKLGDRQRAEEGFEEVIRIGQGDPKDLGYPVHLAQLKLGEFALDGGEFEQAERLARAAVTTAVAWRGESHPMTLRARRKLGDFLIIRKEFDTAREILEPLLDELVPGTAEQNEIRFTREALLDVYRGQDDPDSAEAMLLDAWDLGVEADQGWIAAQLVKLYEDWGREDEAAEWREKAKV